MPDRFDRRVLSDELLTVIRNICAATGGRLGGGAALSGLDLHHRLSNDIDLYSSHAQVTIRQSSPAPRPRPGGTDAVTCNHVDLWYSDLARGGCS